jgi:hypothetical protein
MNTMTAAAVPLASAAPASAPTERPRLASGLGVIAFALAFNVPFSVLASTFDYPDVLRRPAGDVLDLFHAGGASLILTWHAFALCALMMAPLAFVLALTPARIAARPALAIGAAIAGALAGLAQAIGLWRWVFVIPMLAAQHADPAATPEAKLAAEHAFAVLNQYGGVAIGEHLGQLLTALFAVLVAAMQLAERKFVSASLGVLASAAIALGTGEGLAIALGQPGETFATITIAGFLLLTAWLIATGVGLMRGRKG